MGQRSRKRRDGGTPQRGPSPRAATPPPPPAVGPSGEPLDFPVQEAVRPRRKTNAEKDAEARATLEPLAPGERPGPVTAAAVVAVVLALVNVAFAISGKELSEDAGGAGSAIVYTVVLLIAAAGMWRAQYWAVLGFQALLAITALVSFLSLMVASDVWAALLSGVSLLGSGYLFYKLIRAMARIQMPRRRDA